jgi:CMP-N-acetylneuraminic acid synthetase
MTEINNKNLSAMKNKPLISKIIEIILYITEINNKNLSAMKNNPLISTTCG